MNRLLIVAATEFEIRPFLDFIQQEPPEKAPVILITGIGMVATAWQMGRALGNDRFDLAINAGICGSFRPELPPGTLVNVISDAFTEFGAEEGDSFRTLFELGLEHPDHPPFTGGKLIPSPVKMPAPLPPLISAAGITANTIHGNRESIEKLRATWNPGIETMEGAAFFYACILAGIPCLQIRSVSNYVETRDKSKWNIPLAVKNLNDWLIGEVLRY